MRHTINKRVYQDDSLSSEQLKIIMNASKCGVPLRESAATAALNRPFPSSINLLLGALTIFPNRILYNRADTYLGHNF